MKNIIAKIKLVFNYGNELESMLQERRNKELTKEHEYNMHRLNLCHKHRQEQNGSYYSESNCDYCKALKGIKRAFDK